MNSITCFLEEVSTCKMIGTIKDFILLVEAGGHANENYARCLHIALVALYEAGLHFKEIQLSNAGVFVDQFPIEFADKYSALVNEFSQEQKMRNAVFKRTFGKYDDCRFNGQTDLIDFSNSIYSMYKQLKTEVFKIEHPSCNAMAEDGLWQIKNNFYKGWGKDCANAIELLHAFRY